MRIEVLTPEQACGHLSVHMIRTGDLTVRKGQMVSVETARMLTNAGITDIRCAIKEAGELHEDEAAERIARHLQTPHITTNQAATGRVNFTCSALGIVRYDRQLVKQLNLIDEGVTLALVQPNQLLASGDMAATLKIIPFFISEAAVNAVIALIKDNPLFCFHPLTAKRTALIQTRLEHQPDSLFSATQTVTSQRVEMLGSTMEHVAVIPHETEWLRLEIKKAVSTGAELILISGASAITHRDDVIPTAITDAGGRIDRFGMAVDPGNLLMLGQLNDVMIIGMPGCARSPKLNGFDWVLQLYLAGIQINDDELAEMAAGGMLMEIASRPLPRALSARPAKAPCIEAVLLAAGTSSRMGAQNKLTAELDGTPMIRHIAEAIQNSQAHHLTIILGHDADAVASALEGVDARFLFNPDYRSGQASSVKCGLEHLMPQTTDMMMFLGDMPFITTDRIDELIDSHLRLESRWSRITAPLIDGVRGHPVIWGQSFFGDISQIEGDVGARALFNSYPAAVNSVLWNDRTVLMDADTPQALMQMAEHFNTRQR